MKEAVKDNITVCVHTAEKNNGTIRKGIMLTEKEVNVSPTIYLEEYYRQFQKGSTLEYITADILRLYHEVRFQRSWREERVSDYTQIKEKIVYRIVNREQNYKLLQEIPYVSYLDLAIVFCVLLEVTKYGTATMMIRNEHLEMWGVSKSDIYKEASENTCKLLPDEFCTMSAVIEELTGNEQTESKNIMYVLSNNIRSYGAAAILYRGCLKSIGEHLKSSYYVLPSSIHEVIIVPECEEFSKEELSEMVSEVNRIQVDPEEVLSNRAYYYNREKDILYM